MDIARLRAAFPARPIATMSAAARLPMGGGAITHSAPAMDISFRPQLSEEEQG